MGMQALGRTFNAQYLMKGKYVNLKNVAGVAFLNYLTGAAGDTYTLTEAKDASGTGAQVLATITEYWTCTGDGSDTWTKRTQASGSTIITAAAATQNCALFEVQGVELSDGYKYVKVASTGAGLTIAIHTNLLVQRSPGNLTAMGV